MYTIINTIFEQNEVIQHDSNHAPLNLSVLHTHASAALSQRQWDCKIRNFCAPATTSWRSSSSLTNRIVISKSLKQCWGTLLEGEVAMLGTSLVDPAPNLFNTLDVSHLDSLNFGIKTVMHLVVKGRFTNVTVLFPVCVARIEGSKRRLGVWVLAGAEPTYWNPKRSSLIWPLICKVRHLFLLSLKKTTPTGTP